MNTQYLEYFITLYRLKNMHKAAEELFISQQALSKAVKNMENELGVNLFERSSVGMFPTNEGDYFYEKALVIRNELINAKRDVQLISQGKEEVRCVCGYSTPYSFYEHIEIFRDENPDIQIRWYQVSERIAERMLLSGEADIALLSNALVQENFDKTMLFTQNQRLLVYEGHRLWAKTVAEYADLEGEKIIVIAPFQQFVNHLETTCLQHGFILDVIVQTPDYYLAHKLCHEQKGIVVSLADDSINIGYDNIREKPFKEFGYISDVSLVKMSSRALNKATKKLEAYIKECYSKQM